MKQYKIIFTKKARKDLIDIGDYISYTLLEPTTANNLVAGLRRAIDEIRSLPCRYAYIDDGVIQKQEIRCMPYKNYYVFYRIFEEHSAIVIVRIGYNRRNWKEILL